MDSTRYAGAGRKAIGGMSRREFLRLGGTGLAGAAVLGVPWRRRAFFGQPWSRLAQSPKTEGCNGRSRAAVNFHAALPRLTAGVGAELSPLAAVLVPGKEGDLGRLGGTGGGP